MRLPLVTEDSLPHGHQKPYVRIRGQFWGRAAPASVILDKNPGALIFVPGIGCPWQPVARWGFATNGAETHL
jgi:hypothetical protein